MIEQQSKPSYDVTVNKAEEIIYDNNELFLTGLSLENDQTPTAG
ncbi:hypothetical protein [Rickettsia endosymbiont of Halotydeus destructor]